MVQMPGQLIDARAEKTDLVAGVGGYEEEEMAIVVEKTVAVVGVGAAGIVLGGWVVIGERGRTVGALGAVVGGLVRALPRIEATVAEYFGSAGGAILVHIGEVGAW